jgi:hypothetical protein
MTGQLARRVDAAAFGVVMLGFCWWLHTAIVVLAWVSRRQPGAPLALIAAETVAVLLVTLGLPVLVGRLAFRLIRLLAGGCLTAALRVFRLTRGRRTAPLGVKSGGRR